MGWNLDGIIEKEIKRLSILKIIIGIK